MLSARVVTYNWHQRFFCHITPTAEKTPISKTTAALLLSRSNPRDAAVKA